MRWSGTDGSFPGTTRGRRLKMGDRTIAKKMAINYGLSFICEICGSIKYINVHHKDENEKNNNRDNLQILCRKCHFLMHPRCTKIQFICEYCNKAYERYKSRSVGIHNFCSCSCRAKYYVRKRKNELKST
jgi:hypothetical protein